MGAHNVFNRQHHCHRPIFRLFLHLSQTHEWVSYLVFSTHLTANIKSGQNRKQKKRRRKNYQITVRDCVTVRGTSYLYVWKGLRENGFGWTGRANVTKAKILWVHQTLKATWYSGLQERTDFNSFGFSAEGALISASTVPYLAFSWKGIFFSSLFSLLF